MADNWDDVAVALTKRMAELRVTQLEVAARSKISPATIRELQHNHRPRNRFGRTLAALSEALDWPPDHLDAVLNGQPASASSTTDSESSATLRAELDELRGRVDRLERAAFHTGAV